MNAVAIILALLVLPAFGFIAGAWCRDNARRDAAESYRALLCAQDEPLSTQTRAVVEDAVLFYESLKG